MSLHAQISEEAKAALEAQKKTSTISSVVISILAILLLGLILYVISLTIASKVNPEIFSVGNSLADPDDIQEEVTETEVTKQPASPSSSAAKVISALTNSPDSIPTPVTEVADLSLEMGDNTDFGDGWGNGNGTGSGSGAGGFGGAKITGTMGGYFYDFKQTREGKAVRNYSKNKHGNFMKRVKKFHRSRFKPKSLAKHFKGEKELFIRYVAIPFGPATEGPRHFGLEKQVKPSGWMVHYSSKVIAPKDGTFRFVGLGDDYLSVGVNSKPHLMAPWHNQRKDLVSRRTNTDLDLKRPGPFGKDDAERARNNLLNGKWFTVKAGEEIFVDIAFGETPGGMMGYILLIEEKGVEYKKQASGSPILPPFVVGKLHKDDISALKAFPNWTFELDDVPVFTAQD